MKNQCNKIEHKSRKRQKLSGRNSCMFENYKIERIQLLPMSDKEYNNGFKDEEEVQDFLERELIEEDGRYIYNKKGIALENTDALILFQFQNNILGYGIYQTRNRKEKYYKFYADTIYNIEKITANEFKKIVPVFKKSSNVKQIIDMEYFNTISLLLQKKKNVFYRNKNADNQIEKR